MQQAAASAQPPTYPSDYVLKFKTAKSAKLRAYKRAPLTITGDDTATVAAHDHQHIRQIMNAMQCNTYAAAPTAKGKSDENLSPAERGSWEHWQMAAERQVRKHRKLSDADEIVEAKAWQIFAGLLKTHRKGYRLSTIGVDDTLKCSSRLQAMIDGIRDYAIVKSDAWSNINIDEFTANPQGFVSAISPQS
jgi:hypothetical protein